MNQAATDAKPRKRHVFRHPKDGLYAAKERPGFQSRNSGTVATPLRGVFPWPSLLTMPLHYSVLDVER